MNVIRVDVTVSKPGGVQRAGYYKNNFKNSIVDRRKDVRNAKKVTHKTEFHENHEIWRKGSDRDSDLGNPCPKCGDLYVKHTVTKNTANQGRTYKKCVKCGFFCYEKPIANAKVPYHNPIPDFNPMPTYDGNDHIQNNRMQSATTSSTQSVMCKCEEPAQQFITQFGANKNRPYMKCGKKENKCSFWQWAKNGVVKMEPILESMESIGGCSTVTTIVSLPNPSPAPEKKKRADPKCSSCGQIGHTKRKCKYNGK